MKRIGISVWAMMACLLAVAPSFAAEAAEDGPVGVPENLVEQGWTPLLWAVRLGRAAEARELVEAGADVNAANEEGWSPLFMAAEMGNIELFELLFRHCPDASVRSPNGDTPLHHAAAYGLVGTARAAIGKGADVNARRINGSTPLHLAAWYGRTELAALLLAQGAEIEAGFDNGTPIHMAAYGGHLDTVRFLLDKGAEVNARDPRLDTPLHYALYEGHQDVADLLVSAGADPDAENAEGIKPFTPPDKVPVVFDHADREAVIGLVRPVEAAFYRSIAKQDMTGFRETVSGQWRQSITVGEMNEAFKLLMMLDPPRQWWKHHDFILDRLPYLQDNGTLLVNLRYPATGEHVFVSHVYFPENGKWKMGGYYLDFRPYNEVWERHHVASLDHHRDGRHEEAIEEAHRAFNVAVALAPPEPLLILLAAETLADLNLALMDFDESVLFRLFIIEYLIKAAGRTDPRIVGQLDKLTGAYVMFGKLDKAALSGGWAGDLRAAAAGDEEAAKRVEKEMDIERLRAEAPEIPPEDPKLTALREKAEAGEAWSQFDLSTAYDRGRYGLEKDRVLSAQWALRAAVQGLASAQEAMASKYEYGTGVEKDPALAAEWCLKAAGQGRPTALYKMGTFYEAGKGVPRDTEKALEWYRRAQEAGLTIAAKRIEALEK